MSNLLLITPGLDSTSDIKHKYIEKEEDQPDTTTQFDEHQSDEIITHLNTIERSTQRVYMSSQIIQMARRKSLLTNMNKRYGKPQQLLTKMQNRLTVSTKSHPQTSENHMAKNAESVEFTEKKMLDEAEKQEKMLKDKVFLMNTYFSGMSQKKLLRMYEKMENSMDEGMVQIVEYSDADNKWKQKRIKLQSNFFTVMSLNNQHKEVVYLNNPLIEKDATLITMNFVIKIRFANQNICDTWEKALKGLSIFVENIPRTVINQESGLNTIGEDHHVRNHSNDIKQNVLPSLNMNVVTNKTNQTTPQSTPHQQLTPRDKRRERKERKEKEKEIQNEEVKKKRGKFGAFLFPEKEKEKAEKKDDKKDKVEKKEEREEIFGLNLVDFGERNNTENIPKPIKELIDYLKATSTHIEGIFRLCGNQDTILKLKSELESKTIPNFEKYDVHTLAGTLKLYIKEHKDQIVPVQYDRMFVDLLKRKDTLTEEQLHEEFVSIFEQLPNIIKDFIKELTGLLSCILEKSDVNKMKITNIIVCMGPTLRGSPFCYYYTITHYKQLFEK